MHASVYQMVIANLYRIIGPYGNDVCPIQFMYSQVVIGVRGVNDVPTTRLIIVSYLRTVS